MSSRFQNEQRTNENHRHEATGRRRQYNDENLSTPILSESPSSPSLLKSPKFDTHFNSSHMEDITELSSSKEKSCLSVSSSIQSSKGLIFEQGSNLQNSAILEELKELEESSTSVPFTAFVDETIVLERENENEENKSFDVEAQYTRGSDNQSHAISLALGSNSSFTSKLGSVKDWTRNRGIDIRRVGERTQQEIVHYARQATSTTKRVLKRHSHQQMSPIMEPWEELEELKKTHRDKIDGMKAIEYEEHYDFVLVLVSQPVYSFWAERLDFRTECLGEGFLTSIPSVPSRDNTAKTQESIEEDEGKENKSQNEPRPFLTPQNGIRRRKPTNLTPDISELTKDTSFPTVLPRQNDDEKSSGLDFSFTLDTEKAIKPRLSLFERAVTLLSPSQTPTTIEEGKVKLFSNSTPRSKNRRHMTPGKIPQTARRRWGNRTMLEDRASTRTFDTISNSSRRHREISNRSNDSISHISLARSSSSKVQKLNPNVIDEEDIPSQTIPRGIAKRSNRSNGMMFFLSALKRGIVLRCHRPGVEASFTKIFSSDGGDTIKFEPVTVEEAMLAFKEQGVRFNDALTKEGKSVPAQRWSYMDIDEDKQLQKFQVPDFIAEERRREYIKDLKIEVFNNASKIKRSGKIRIRDVITLHPALHVDPRASNQFGTSSLRKSKSRYSKKLSFSLVMKGNRPIQESMGNIKKNTASDSERWLSGKGKDSSFKIVNFEAATEGEYWLVFRGLLLLHRDAASGRFAKDRTSGFGGNYIDEENHNILQRNAYHEPRNVGMFEKLIAKIRKEDISLDLEGSSEPGVIPPPSDYFLGFRSPGTQIWSRLRQAGFETTRIYAIDPCRVMIKIRCPIDRLTDVAEVLKIKLKTRDGSFAPFREDAIETFLPLNDELDAPKLIFDDASLFRSSERQKVIDFIVRSRIRDSGAQLGQENSLGKMIQARVPLHMKEKLESLYKVWFFFWRRTNWTNRDGRSMSVSPPELHPPVMRYDKENANMITSPLNINYKIPNCIYRFIIGSFYQPLDSIEQYFGEKVAFYFAWLQHCAGNLVSLSIAGLIVTICQVSTGQWDHPIRPFFSVFVMLWSFFTLVNWRQRQNALAYRWGNMDHKVQETTRPQFKGQYRRDSVTGEYIVHYSTWKRYLKYLISFPITLAFTAGTLLLILHVHANRDQLLVRYIEQKVTPGSKEFEIDFSLSAIGKPKPVTSVELNRDHLMDPTFWYIMIGLPSLLGLCLPILNFILMKICIMLTEFENYRTESHYRTALIVKVFAFRFVCYFATLYYYCFLSVGDKQAVENGILRVGAGVIIYLLVSHWWGIWLSFNFPLWIFRIRRHRQKKRLHEELIEVEKEEQELQSKANNEMEHKILEERKNRLVNKRLLLDQAQDELWQEVMLPQHNSFPEYIQAVVQFAFVTCFSVVLPITPIICLMNHLISMRLDAYKLCKTRQRPLAQKTGGIGVWEHVLHVVTVIAVLTNCWLMGFTNEQFRWIGEKTGQLGLFAIVVGWEHIMLLIKYVIQTSTPKMSREVKEAIRKEQYDANKRLNLTMRAKQDRRSQRYFLSPNLSRVKGNRVLKTVFSSDNSEASPLTPKTNKSKTVDAIILDPKQTISNDKKNTYGTRRDEVVKGDVKKWNSERELGIEAGEKPDVTPIPCDLVRSFDNERKLFSC